jgi:hypothetical protein
MTYPNGDLVSYLPTIFEARVIDGEPHADGEEAIDVAWFTTHQLADTALSEFTITSRQSAPRPRAATARQSAPCIASAMGSSSMYRRRAEL